MKIKAIDGLLVQYPGVPGVYVGAVVTREIVKDANGVEVGARYVTKWSGEAVDLRPEGQSLQDWKIARIRDNSLAYWMRKVKDGDLIAADEEMATLCGQKWSPPAPAAKAAPTSPAPVPAKPEAAK